MSGLTPVTNAVYKFCYEDSVTAPLNQRSIYWDISLLIFGAPSTKQRKGRSPKIFVEQNKNQPTRGVALTS